VEREGALDLAECATIFTSAAAGVGAEATVCWSEATTAFTSNPLSVFS